MTTNQRRARRQIGAVGWFLLVPVGMNIAACIFLSSEATLDVVVRDTHVYFIVASAIKGKLQLETDISVSP